MTEDQLPIRGANSPYTDEADDTQGHRIYGSPNEEVDIDDVEGHIYVEDRDEPSGQRLR